MSKKIVILGIIFISLSFLFYMNVETNKVSDFFFHEELVDRIQDKRPLNEPMNFTIDNHAYLNEVRTWDKQYVTNYPKSFHYLASILPFSAEENIKLTVSMLLSLLFIGIITIVLAFKKPLSQGILAGLLFFMSTFISWNYIWYYLNAVYSQLLMNVIGVFGFAICVTVFMQKRYKLLILSLMTTAILIVMVKQIPNIPDLLMNSPRFLPLIFSIMIPTIIGVIRYGMVCNGRTKKKMQTL